MKEFYTNEELWGNSDHLHHVILKGRVNCKKHHLTKESRNSYRKLLPFEKSLDYVGAVACGVGRCTIRLDFSFSNPSFLESQT